MSRKTRTLAVAAALLCLARTPSATITTLVVTSAADTDDGVCDADCTLREAINASDAVPLGDVAIVNFAIGTGAKKITLTGPLPAITRQVEFHGETQPTYTSFPLIEINGGFNSSIFNVTGGAGVVISGFVLNHAAYPIRFTGGDGHTARDCWIGTSADGSSFANASEGIHIENVSNVTIQRDVINASSVGIFATNSNGLVIEDSTIGLDATGTSLLSSFLNGIALQASDAHMLRNTVAGPSTATLITLDGLGTVVRSNRFGTDTAESTAFPNSTGFAVTGGGNATFGGSGAGDGNTFGGSSGAALLLGGAGGNHLQGNFFGLDRTGTVPLSNGVAVVVTSSNNDLTGNTIANSTAAAVVVPDNPSGPPFTFNSIRANSIFNSGGLAIDLNADGVTPNDAGDADTGPNDLQNFPQITGAVASGSSLTISGFLSSTAGATFKLDFYRNPSCGSLGYGQERDYIGEAIVATPGSGIVTFSKTFPFSASLGDLVAGTATNAGGSTSEVSQCHTATFETTTSGLSPTQIPTTPTRTPTPDPLKWFASLLCRQVDTRVSGNPLDAGTDSTWVLTGPPCGVPATAKAITGNVTVTGATAPGDLRIYPKGSPLPLVSTINFRPGQTRANNFTVALGQNGDILTRFDAIAGAKVHVIIDISGYFSK